MARLLIITLGLLREAGVNSFRVCIFSVCSCVYVLFACMCCDQEIIEEMECRMSLVRPNLTMRDRMGSTGISTVGQRIKHPRLAAAP